MSSTKDLINYYYEARDEVNVRVKLFYIRGNGVGIHILNDIDSETFCGIDLTKVDQSCIEIKSYQFTECQILCVKCLSAVRKSIY